MRRPIDGGVGRREDISWLLWARRQVWIVRWIDGLRQNFWFTPLLCTAAAPLLAWGLLSLNSPESLWTPPVETQRTFHSMVAGTMVAVTASTFTLVMAVLSLASSQFGPRLIGQFLKDGVAQLTLGLFLGIATYHAIALIWVPATALVFYAGLVLSVVAIIVLVLFLQHLAQSVHADTVVDRVSADLEQTLKTLCTAAPVRIPPSPFPHIITAEDSGYLQAVDLIQLRRSAIAADLTVQVAPRPGQFVLHGEPLLRTDAPVDDPASFLRAVWTGTARSVTQDIEFAFEQLAEMAVRALSPGINDPYTARRCIDRIASGLQLFNALGAPDPMLADDDGTPRVWMRWPNQEEVYRAATARIQHAAKDDPQTCAHLEAILRRIPPHANDEEPRQG